MTTQTATRPRTSNAHVLHYDDVMPAVTGLPYIRKTVRLNRADTGLEWVEKELEAPTSGFFHTLSAPPGVVHVWPTVFHVWPTTHRMNVMGICLREEHGWTNMVAPSRQTTSSIDVDLDRIFARAQHEDFEAGMCSQFESQLRAFAGQYGERAITALHDRLQRATNTEICVEAIGSMGRMRLGVTRDARLASLATFLKHKNFEVRDAAMRALLDMQDRRALAPLRRAHDAEPNKRLKKSFEEVIALLAA